MIEIQITPTIIDATESKVIVVTEDKLHLAVQAFLNRNSGFWAWFKPKPTGADFIQFYYDTY